MWIRQLVKNVKGKYTPLWEKKFTTSCPFGEILGNEFVSTNFTNQIPFNLFLISHSRFVCYTQTRETLCFLMPASDYSFACFCKKDCTIVYLTCIC